MNCVHCSDVAELIGPAFSWLASGEVAGSLISAFSGAYAATWFAARRETNSILSGRLDDINRALSLASSAAASAIMYKEQITSEITSLFFEERKRFENFQAAGSKGAFMFTVDIRDLQDCPPIFEKLGATVEALSITSEVCFQACRALTDSCISLHHSLAGRKEALQRITEKYSNQPVKYLPYPYFGFPLGTMRDTGLYESVDGIHGMADNLIYFSYFIFDELMKEALRIDKKLGDRSQGIRRVDLGKVRESEFFPKLEKYKNWEELRR